jgi:hypothetical protein
MVLKAVSCNGDHNPGEDVPLPVCGNEGREMRSGRNQASAVVRQGRDRVERHHEHGEKNFDEVKKHARKWSMWDNNVPMGQEPKLVSRNFDDEPNLRKSQNDSKILIWKRH